MDIGAEKEARPAEGALEVIPFQRGSRPDVGMLQVPRRPLLADQQDPEPHVRHVPHALRAQVPVAAVLLPVALLAVVDHVVVLFGGLEIGSGVHEVGLGEQNDGVFRGDVGARAPKDVGPAQDVRMPFGVGENVAVPGNEVWRLGRGWVEGCGLYSGLCVGDVPPSLLLRH